MLNREKSKKKRKRSRGRHPRLLFIRHVINISKTDFTKRRGYVTSVKLNELKKQPQKNFFFKAAFDPEIKITPIHACFVRWSKAARIWDVNFTYSCEIKKIYSCNLVYGFSKASAKKITMRYKNRTTGGKNIQFLCILLIFVCLVTESAICQHGFSYMLFQTFIKKNFYDFCIFPKIASLSRIEPESKPLKIQNFESEPELKNLVRLKTLRLFFLSNC